MDWLPLDHDHINQVGGSLRRPLRRLRDDPLDTVAHLVDAIGPRRASALREAQAAAYLNGRLRRAGMDVSAEAFRTRLAPGWDGLVIAALSLAGVALARWSPVLALGIFVAALGWALLLAWRNGMPLLHHASESQNVVGIRSVGSTAPRWRVVLLAPLDSPLVVAPVAQLLADRPRAVLGRVLAATLLVVLELAVMFGGAAWWYAQWLPLVYLLLLAGVEVLLLRAPASPGAVHHAGALAVLLASVEELAALEQVEVWAVGIGAASLADGGLTDLLRRYPFEQERALFIGLEGIGSGAVCYLTREGMLREHPADPLLLRLVAAADAADPLVDAEPRPLRSQTLFGHTLQRAGQRALTMTCLGEDDRAPYHASMADILAVIEAPVLERAVRLVIGIIQQLDAEPETR